MEVKSGAFVGCVMMIEECVITPSIIEGVVPISIAVNGGSVSEVKKNPPEAPVPQPLADKTKVKRSKNSKNVGQSLLVETLSESRPFFTQEKSEEKVREAQMKAKQRARARRIERQLKLETEAKMKKEQHTARKKRAQVNTIPKSLVMQRSHFALKQIVEQRRLREEDEHKKRTIAERRRDLMRGRYKIKCPGPLSPFHERKREALQRRIRRDTAARLARNDAQAQSMCESEATEISSKLDRYLQRKRELSTAFSPNARPSSRCNSAHVKNGFDEQHLNLDAMNSSTKTQVASLYTDESIPAPDDVKNIKQSTIYSPKSGRHTPVWRRKVIPVTTPYQNPFPPESMLTSPAEVRRKPNFHEERAYAVRHIGKTEEKKAFSNKQRRLQHTKDPKVPYQQQHRADAIIAENRYLQ